jgi:hypothetical protein
MLWTRTCEALGTPDFLRRLNVSGGQMEARVRAPHCRQGGMFVTSILTFSLNHSDKVDIFRVQQLQTQLETAKLGHSADLPHATSLCRESPSNHETPQIDLAQVYLEHERRVIRTPRQADS